MAHVAIPVVALSVALSPAGLNPIRPAAALTPLTVSAVPTMTPLALTPSLRPAAAIEPSFEAPVPAVPLRSLNSFWDGFRLDLPEDVEPVQALAAQADGSIGEERLAPWLATDDPKTAAAIDAAIELAMTTKAGRRAVSEAEAVLSENPLPVVAGALGRNFGEYDFVLRRMRLHRALFAPGREADLAGTIVHELTHVAQHAVGVPSNALEMEIEAHLQDLEFLRELGLEPPPNTFARQAYEALRESPRAFVKLIQSAVPATVYLGDTPMDDIVEQLESDLEEQNEKKTKTAAGIAKAIEQDLILLSTEEGRASYRAFSRRVGALLRRRHAAARK